MTINKQKTVRTSTAHRKRLAQHHKRTSSYKKPYWPYLPIIALLLVGFVVNAWLGSTRFGVLGYATNASIDGLAAYTNTERTARGLGALAVNGVLNQAAQAKANDMAANNYWSHNSPSGATPWTFIQNAGYSYLSAGENLAYGFSTSAETIVGWMNSPSHRDNILNAGFKEVGFGIANAENYQSNGPQTIVVAMYASPAGTTAPDPLPSPQPNPAPTPAPVPAPAPSPSKASNSTPVQSQSAVVPSAPEEPAPPAEQLTPAQLTPAALPKNATTRTDSPAQQAQADTVAPKRITRISMITKANAQWSTLAVLCIASVAAAGFLLRHTLAWHRFLLRGERFIINHPLFDIALVGTAIIGFMLAQATGVIR